MLLSDYIITFIHRSSPKAYLWFICNHCSNYPLSHLNSFGVKTFLKADILTEEAGKIQMASAELLCSFAVADQLGRAGKVQE